MINRILIRIKVVQILYSYLLSRSEFKIDAAPQGTSRDRRFAYAVYLDMLCLIQELSGVRTNNPERRLPAIDVHPKLKANRVARALADNPTLKEITYRNISDLNVFGALLQRLSDKITSTSCFTEYAHKRTHTLDDDVRLWTVLLETTVLKDSEVVAALRSNPEFSLTGLHYGIMQTVDTLKAYGDARSMYQKAKKELEESLDKGYELYYALFVLMIELTAEQADRIESAKNKYLATAEDLNPDTRLVDNRFVRFLSENEELQKFRKDHPYTWVDSSNFLKKMLDDILESDVYAEYVGRESTDWESDCEFWRSALRSVVLPSDALGDAIESKSIYWNDDVATVGTFALKSIRHFASSEEGKGVRFLSQFKDDEDAEFGAKLFNLAIENREKYREYIDRFISPDWDPDRLAFMDIVIMTVAIAEIMNFPGIPIPVSMNEYVEIANIYSTRRSGPFINGILFSVAKMLADEGLLSKPLGQSHDGGDKTDNQ